MTEFEKMIQFLDTSWIAKREIVPCLIGPPGIGKTAAVKQHAEKHGAKIVKIVASRCVPSETVGMTMPDHEHRSMAIYNSMQLSSLRDGDILFLDELLEADQFVLSTLLTVIESREMADGTPLPDIQIIAATNDTIPPEQLKLNIRQRFMFMWFEMHINQTRDYIKERTGLELDPILLSHLETKDRGKYNLLTPRSLTKLCLWMNEVPEDMIYVTASVINCIWGSAIGDGIAEARIRRDSDPVEQVINKVESLIEDGIITDMPDDNIRDCTAAELLAMLQGLPNWNEIAEQLESEEIKEPEDTREEIQF